MARDPIHPGEHLAEALEEEKMSAAEFARQIGVPTNRITGILNGKRALTADTALRLGHWFGTSAEMWLNLQKLYELRLAEREKGAEIRRLPKRKAAVIFGGDVTRLDPEEVISLLRQFNGVDLTQTLSSIENAARGLNPAGCVDFLKRAHAESDVLTAAAEMKQYAGQIHVTVHALGILLCLPHILEDGEIVEYLSLGAGNTGRAFDIETNYRIAEFKFIQWKGGPESIRQNGIFKDFFLLAEAPTEKRKYLYVLGDLYPRKFFNGGRSLTSVLSKDERTRDLFRSRYANRFPRVRDYYASVQHMVAIEDVSPWLPQLVAELERIDATP